MIERQMLEEAGIIPSKLKPEPKPEKLFRLMTQQDSEQKTDKRKGKQKAKKDEERKVKQTSFLNHNDCIYEQVNNDGINSFIGYNSKKEEIMTMTSIEVNGEIMEPIVGEDIELGAIKLPSGILEYGKTETLLAEIEAHIYKYLDVSSPYLKFASYYVLLSWLYDRFHTIPYLRALGDTGCGKSRFLDVIGGLCYKPISASGCVTPAPIYRMLRKWGGTLILDEADMKNSDEYNEVVTILNCGFERGRPVIRAQKDNPDKLQILPVYGPKVFATRRRFKDVALEARCLTEIMRETDRDDIPPVLNKKFFEEQENLRNKLLLFRLINYHKINPEAGCNVAIDVEPRLKQISEAFISLFANEPKALEAYKVFLHEHQRELIEERAATKTGQVVEALFELIGNKVTMVTTVTGENVFDVTSKDIADKVGLTSQATGQILKGLGLETKLCKIDGVSKRRIVNNSAILNKLRKRYIPEDKEFDGETTFSLSPVTNVTNVTHVTEDNFWQGLDDL